MCVSLVDLDSVGHIVHRNCLITAATFNSTSFTTPPVIILGKLDSIDLKTNNRARFVFNLATCNIKPPCVDGVRIRNSCLRGVDSYFQYNVPHILSSLFYVLSIIFFLFYVIVAQICFWYIKYGFYNCSMIKPIINKLHVRRSYQVYN